MQAESEEKRAAGAFFRRRPKATSTHATPQYSHKHEPNQDKKKHKTAGFLPVIRNYFVTLPP